MLQEAIYLVKGSLKRRCVASCKKKLPRVTAPLGPFQTSNFTGTELSENEDLVLELLSSTFETVPKTVLNVKV